MTFKEAKERAKQVSSQDWVKFQQRRRNAIHQKLKKEEKIECAWLPPLLCQRFEKEVLQEKVCWGEETPIPAALYLLENCKTNYPRDQYRARGVVGSGDPHVRLLQTKAVESVLCAKGDPRVESLGQVLWEKFEQIF